MVMMYWTDVASSFFVASVNPSEMDYRKIQKSAGQGICSSHWPDGSRFECKIAVDCKTEINRTKWSKKFSISLEDSYDILIKITRYKNDSRFLFVTYMIL